MKLRNQNNQIFDLVEPSNDPNYIKIKQATKQGWILCEVGGVADLSYPNSKLRRGRVQGGGQISPTITSSCGIYRIERTEDE